ncbi:MAG: 30S ribosomal protein S6 [Planctomycetales bacterium]|nr:30S ribosomal protein S6 [Planctomycetales bacterium]
MATHCYDCFFLFDSNKYNRDPGGVSAAAQKIIEDLGGEILASRFWEERKLAYPINGHVKGTYWITYFNLDSLRVPEFNRACQLNESILRFLLTRVDPRLTETLVAHALGKVSAPAEEKATVAVAADADDDDDEIEDDE